MNSCIYVQILPTSLRRLCTVIYITYGIKYLKLQTF